MPNPKYLLRSFFFCKKSSKCGKSVVVAQQCWQLLPDTDSAAAAVRGRPEVCHLHPTKTKNHPEAKPEHEPKPWLLLLELKSTLVLLLLVVVLSVVLVVLLLVLSVVLVVLLRCVLVVLRSVVLLLRFAVVLVGR